MKVLQFTTKNQKNDSLENEKNYNTFYFDDLSASNACF